MTGYRSKFFRHQCDGDGCYIQGLPSWDDIIEVMPRGIRPTDIDGFVEINDRFLFIEEKSAGVAPDEGQRRALLKLSRRPGITIAFLRPGGFGSEVEFLVLEDGQGTGWQQRTRGQFLDWVRDWCERADAGT